MVLDVSLVPFMRHIVTRGTKVDWFVMIGAYVDESGTHEESPTLSVAITAASIDGWAGIGKGWLPRIANLKGGYHAKNHSFLHGALADLMVEHTLFSSFITLREEDYDRHFPHWVKSVIGGAYARGVLFSLMTYAAWSRENNAGPAYYFIEQGHRHFPQVVLMLRVIRLSPELREMYAMVDWAPATKEDIPIHCPDTLSHHATMHYGSGSYGPFVDKLYAADKVWRGHVSEEVIKESVPQFKEVARILLRAMKEDRKARKGNGCDV